ncbi:MAG: hypothetical protein DRN35_02405 [Thermoplasmata archaeon]|nr:MAG: hypothetical protein DRN35_02405 [Thermoplasmata archaeon]RLF74215.1 MAG: hypothetical protein DRN42_04855 [Thermoplasmata archaeon]HDD60702.1 hypothetical protein [Euryarchaeota archaeon]
MTNCPSCGSDNVRKKGKRVTGAGEKQIYQCRECGRRFTEGLPGIRYPPYVVTDALTLYNMGYNLDEVARSLRKRYKTRLSRSTVGRWIEKNRDIIPFITLREEALKKYDGEMIVEKEVTHRGITYPFAYHRYKLEKRCSDLPGLRGYIENFSEEGRFFEDGERCSEVKLDVRVKKEVKVNLASRMARFVLEGVRVKKERHREIERFMLVNDSATVAVEVPVYFYDKKLGSVSGHIDLLQVRFGDVYVLDYKPDAEGEHPEAQLYFYALAISFRTKVPLQKIKCAWFDESVYYEFSPAKARVSYPGKE